MARNTSTEAAWDRHRNYPIDVANELNQNQVGRLTTAGKMIPPGSSVLDIGCNTGTTRRFLHKDVAYYGIDIAHIIWRGTGKLVNGVAEHLPFCSNAFTHAILGEILEHVYSPSAVVREAARVTTVAVVGSVPTESSQWGAGRVAHHAYHVRAFTADSLFRALMAGAAGRWNIHKVGDFYHFEGKDLVPRE